VNIPLVWQLAGAVAGSVAVPGVPLVVYAVRDTRQNARQEAAFAEWARTGQAQPGGDPRMCWSSAMASGSPFQSWRALDRPASTVGSAPVQVRRGARPGDPVQWWIAEAPGRVTARPWWDVTRLWQVTGHRDPRWATRRAVTSTPDRRAA
jgi:hypothetical protein